MSTDEFALVVRALHKRFGAVVALNGLSLAVRRGEIYGLLGPNGAGKTTALRIVCGLLAPDGGDGHCLGSVLGGTPPALGYLPQRGGLYEDLTVVENLRFFARAHGLENPRRHAEHAMRVHGLTTRAAQRVGTLSGGWRQRVGLAAALLHAPKLLLLDEPTAGLDPNAREQLWHQLRGLSAAGVTILVTTHYADEAERCDRIGYLSTGRLRVEGSPARIAESLGLSVWRIAHVDPTHATPRVVGGASLLRDSEGWRAIATTPDPPSALIDWCAQFAVAPQPTPPRLTDALAWLATDAPEVA